MARIYVIMDDSGFVWGATTDIEVAEEAREEASFIIGTDFSIVTTKNLDVEV